MNATLIAAPAATPKVITAAPKIGQAVRQGDVLIQRIATVPDGLPIRTDRNLAIGSRSAHACTEPADLLDGPSGQMFLVSPSEFTVTHDEHAHIRLPGGAYKVWKQVEFPAGVISAPRTVRD